MSSKSQPRNSACLGNQGDIETDGQGNGFDLFVGRFSIETFIVSPGAEKAPVVFSKNFPDGAIGTVVGRIHTYYCRLWFNSPVDAKNAGALATVTPFNGEGNAGVQVLNTANFPDLAGPLAFVRYALEIRTPGATPERDVWGMGFLLKKARLLAQGNSSEALTEIGAYRKYMIQRFDQIAVDLPEPSGPNPAAAAAIQELMGGKFGEMSTLMNYTFQSFNFRGKEKYRPFYDLICNIAAEEYSHIEAVAATINLLLNGAVPRADRNKPFGEDADSKKKKAANKRDFGDANPAPLSDPAITAFYRYHFANSGQAAVPFDGMGNPWNGSYVTATGNLKMDLLHNFFLECGARAGKSRVYEMAPDPTSRAMCGYLLVRGGVHIVAYAKALEKLTGTPVSGLLPIPDVSNKKFPEAMALEAQGLHTIMWKWCPSDTYTEIGEIWNGPHPEDGMELEVRDEMPPGFPWPEMPDEPQICAPGEIDPEMLNYYAEKLA